MPSAYSNLKFELMTTGENPGTWGNRTNTNIGTAIEQALVGMATLTSANFASNEATLTLADTSAAQDARALCLNIAAGAIAGAGVINVPAIQKPYLIINNSSFSVTVKVSGLTGVTVPAGKRSLVYNNGTDVGNQIDYFTSLTVGALTLSAPLPIASGGTNATSASTARTSLGASVVGSNLFTLANPSAVTFMQINADNTVTTLDAASFRTAIGAGSGGGTVTSVSGTSPILVANGSTTPNISMPFASASASGYLTSTDWQAFNLKLTSGGALGTPSSGNLTNCTFPTLNQNTTGTAAGLSSILAVASGGTGTATPALVAGTNVTITGTWPNQTINSTASGGGGGTVTSVAALTLGTTGTDLSSTVANSTTTPVITLNVPTASATNRGVLSSADWTTFNNKGSGTVTSVTGTAPVVSSGGTTPAISMAAASASANGYLTSTDWSTFNNKQPAGSYLTSGGALGTPSSGTLTNCTFPTLNQNTTGNAATATTATNLSGGTVAATTITATGNITAYFTSDIKFKENIRAIPDALAKVNAIGGKLYDWTDEYIANQGGVDNYFVNKADFGVVAQDVLRVFPIAVHKRPDGSLAVDYIKLAALSFAALVELTARVEALESR